VPDKHGILQIQRFHQFGEIIGIGIHVITMPGLAGSPVPPAISSDAAIAVARHEEHLSFKSVRVQAIRMVKNNGLPFPQSLKSISVLSFTLITLMCAPIVSLFCVCNRAGRSGATYDLAPEKAIRDRSHDGSCSK
jgi:hypothetical protein